MVMKAKENHILLDFFFAIFHFMKNKFSKNQRRLQ
jgi:hypothetical protein